MLAQGETHCGKKYLRAFIMTRDNWIYKKNLHILFTYGDGLIFCFYFCSLAIVIRKVLCLKLH